LTPQEPAPSVVEPVTYAQFTEGSVLRQGLAVGAVLCMPLALPFALLGRLSDILFRSCSELLGQVPYLPGVMLRNAFYRLSLTACGRNVIVEYGTILLYRNVRIGENVLLGRHNILHLCDVGDWVLTGERCTFLSGSRYHAFERLDIPIALQGGERRRIRVGRDCWIGAHAVVMDDIGDQSVVAAGAVVSRPVPAATVVAGVPARVVRARGASDLSGE
jgi:acetyltransferase-like isoleucine patch superfamily enzyme